MELPQIVCSGILDDMPSGLVLSTLDGLVLYRNRAASQMIPVLEYQYQLFDLLPTAWNVVEDSVPRQSVMAGANGEELTAVISKTSLDGETPGLLVIFHNPEVLPGSLASPFGEPVSAYEALGAILSSSFDGLWLIDKSGTVLMINQGAERIHRLKKSQIIGKNINELSNMKVMDRSITREVFRHRKTITINQKLPRIDREILATAHPVFDGNDELKFVVIVDRDVTELNRLRREIQESQIHQERFRYQALNPAGNESLVDNGVINSSAMKRVYQQAIQAAQTESTILVTGESGVGKGFFVRLIHDASKQKKGPLTHLDCGAIPESLIDSELFGYESGAFTGARKEGRPGYLETANNGTLFLDEISELPISAQVKLLRFLDSNEFVRVGGVETRKSQARIVAATNKNLEEMVANGEFRKDLYFRLNVVPLLIPPLRTRQDEIPYLIQHYLNIINTRNQTGKTIGRRAMDLLLAYSYPGNVRELINIVEQMMVLSSHDHLGVEDLPQHVTMDVFPLAAWTGSKGWKLKEAVDALEREMIQEALTRFGTQRKAADFLGIDQSTLARKAKKYGICWEMVIHRDD